MSGIAEIRAARASLPAQIELRAEAEDKAEIAQRDAVKAHAKAWLRNNNQLSAKNVVAAWEGIGANLAAQVDKEVHRRISKKRDPFDTEHQVGIGRFAQCAKIDAKILHAKGDYCESQRSNAAAVRAGTLVTEYGGMALCVSEALKIAGTEGLEALGYGVAEVTRAGATLTFFVYDPKDTVFRHTKA